MFFLQNYFNTSAMSKIKEKKRSTEQISCRMYEDLPHLCLKSVGSSTGDGANTLCCSFHSLFLGLLYIALYNLLFFYFFFIFCFPQKGMTGPKCGKLSFCAAAGATEDV